MQLAMETYLDRPESPESRQRRRSEGSRPLGPKCELGPRLGEVVQCAQPVCLESTVPVLASDTPGSNGAGGAQELYSSGAPGPFDSALKEAHAALMNAHYATIATLEAELQHMRNENTRLRAYIKDMALDNGGNAGSAKVQVAAVPSTVADQSTIEEGAGASALEVPGPVPVETSAYLQLKGASLGFGGTTYASQALSNAPEASPVAPPSVGVGVPKMRSPPTLTESGESTRTDSSASTSEHQIAPAVDIVTGVTPSVKASDECKPEAEEARKGSNERRLERVETPPTGMPVQGAPSWGLRSQVTGLITPGCQLAEPPSPVETRSFTSHSPVDPVPLAEPPAARPGSRAVICSGWGSEASTTSVAEDETAGSGSSATIGSAIAASQSSRAPVVEQLHNQQSQPPPIPHQLGPTFSNAGSVPWAGTLPSSGLAVTGEPQQQQEEERIEQHEQQQQQHHQVPQLQHLQHHQHQQNPQHQHGLHHEDAECVLGATVTPATSDADMPLNAGGTDVGGSISTTAIPLPDASPVRSIDRELEALLARNNWTHLDVNCVSQGVWTISGATMLLKFADKSFDGSVPCLVASADGGCTWEVLEEHIRRRRLQKVVRTAPFATGTLEYSPERPLSRPLSPQPVVCNRPVDRGHGSPLSLKELASLQQSRDEFPSGVPTANAIPVRQVEVSYDMYGGGAHPPRQPHDRHHLSVGSFTRPSPTSSYEVASFARQPPSDASHSFPRQFSHGSHDVASFARSVDVGSNFARQASPNELAHESYGGGGGGSVKVQPTAYPSHPPYVQRPSPPTMPLNSWR